MRTMFKNYFKLLVFLGVFVGSWLAGFDVGAQTTTWTGGATGAWNVASNWDNGVPTATNKAVISTTNAVVTLPASTVSQALELELTNNAQINIPGTAELNLNGAFKTNRANPINNANAGLLSFQATGATTGPLQLERTDGTTSGGFITVSRIGVTGNVSLEFATGTSVYVQGAGVDVTSMFISAGVGNAFGFDLSTGSELAIDVQGRLDFDGANANTSLGSLLKNPAGSVSFVAQAAGAQDFEVNEITGVAFSTVTFWSDVTVQANAQVDTDDGAANSVNVLRFNGNLTNNGSSNAFDVAGGSNVSAPMIFSNTLNDQTISGNFMTVSMLSVVKSSGSLILNTSLLAEGTATGVGNNIIEFPSPTGSITINAGQRLAAAPVNATQNDIFAATSNLTGNNINGAGTLVILDRAVADVDMASDLVVLSNMDVGGSIGDASQLDIDNGSTGANQLYFGGINLNLYESTAFGVANGSYMQFLGSDNQFVSAHEDATVELPALEIAKNGGDNAVFLTVGTAVTAATINYQISVDNDNGAGDEIIVFTSADDFGNFATVSESQLVLNGANVILAANVANGDLQDETFGKGNISGAGDFRFNAATDLASDFAIGADVLLNSNVLNMLNNNFTFGGDLLEGLTAGDAAATGFPIVNDAGGSPADNEFVTIGTVNRASGNSTLDVAQLNNIVIKRNINVAQQLINRPDNAAGTTNIIFDGGSFTSAHNIVVDVLANSEIHFTTTNTGMFANGFVTVNSNPGTTLELHSPVAMTTVQFTSSGTGLFIEDANVVINLDGHNANSGNLVLGGDLINNGASQLFTNLDNDDFIVFDVPTSVVNSSNGFTTVGGDKALTVERLKVQSANPYSPLATNLQCSDPSNDFTSGALVFQTSVHIKGAASNDILLDLSSNGFVSVDVDATVELSANGNVAVAAAPNYSVITGPGTLAFNGPTAPGNQFSPTNGNVIVGITNWTNVVPMQIDNELALTGNLFLTINRNSTGKIRMIGGNFQTVAPGVATTGVPANTAFIPNLIIDKCLAGPFTTAFISSGYPITIGRDGVVAGGAGYGFLSVNSGTLDNNAFISIYGKGDDGGLLVNNTNGGTFITTVHNPVTAGYAFGNTDIVAGGGYQVIRGTNANAFISIPNLAIGVSAGRDVNNFPVGGATANDLRLMTANVVVYNTDHSVEPYSLLLANTSTSNPGNLDLNQNTLFITGGGTITTRQEPNIAGGLQVLPETATTSKAGPRNQAVQQNISRIKNGFVTVSGLGTTLEFTSAAYVSLPTVLSNRYTIEADVMLTDFAGMSLNSNQLELKGNLTHNSFNTAFVTTSEGGLLNMSNTFSTITFQTAELFIPSLKVGGTLDLVDAITGAGVGNLLIGHGRDKGLAPFTSVLEITTSLDINTNFVTVTGPGGFVAGTVNGGTKDQTGGGARVDAPVTLSNDFKFTQAGVTISDGTNLVTGLLGRVNVVDKTLTLGGNLYEQTGATSATAADAFITTGYSDKGLVVFDCPAGTTQFISSNGDVTAISPNVFISGNDVTLGIGSTDTDMTSDNVMLYLAGSGNGADFDTDGYKEATLYLANNTATGGNNARLNLGFNSVTFLASSGSLLDDDNRATGEESMIGFGTVTAVNATTAMITVGSHFGIKDDLVSNGSAQINLGGNSLFLGGDYANSSSVTKAFVTATTNDNSTLVLNGTAFQTVSITSNLAGVPAGTATYTEIPHITVAGVGTQLASHVAAYGGAGDALYLNAPLYLNGQFMTVTNEGTTVNAVYSSNTAFISGLAAGNSDGLYFKSGALTTNLRSNLTVLEAGTFIHDGHTVNMTENFTLSLGGDLEATNGTALSVANGGASITSADANGHGWVKFITSTEATSYDMQGINRVPALAVEIATVVNFNQSPNNFTSITSNLAGEVLKFMSGTFNLNANQTLAVLGNGNNTVSDLTTGNYQVFQPSATTGTLWIAGNGTTNLELGDSDNTNGSELVINPGLSMRGTAIPNLSIGKAGLTAVNLGGNLYLGTPNAANSDNQFLSIAGGTLDLKGNNIQFMTGAGLKENSSAGYVITNSGMTNYPANGQAYAGTEAPMGVVFATVTPESNASRSLGLQIVDATNNPTFAIELRKDAAADGKDIYGNTINIARNYKITPSGTFNNTLGNDQLAMTFTTAEIVQTLGTNVTAADLSFITFGNTGVNSAVAGTYSPLTGGNSTDNTAFNDFTTVSGKGVANNLPLGFYGGYITLGVRPVNIVHDLKFENGVATTDTSLDAEADEADANNANTTSTSHGTAGRYRILNSKNANNFDVTFTTVIPTVRLNAQGQPIPGSNQPIYGQDYLFATNSNGTGLLNPNTSGFFTITIPANQTETPLYVIPLDDNYVDGNEFLSVSITNVTNGMVLGKFTTATMQILDNDVPGFNVQINNRGSVKGSGFTTVGANYQVTSTTDVSGGFISVNEYIAGDGQGVLESVVGVNLRQAPIPGKVVYLRMTIPTGTTATVDTNLDLNGQADKDGVNEAMFTSVVGNAGTFVTSTGSTLQTTQWLDIPFSADGSTIGGVDTYLWSDFVSVTLQGKNDFVADHGQAPVQRYENFHVVVEVEKTKTNSTDYLEPNKLLPSNATDPNALSASLGKVILYGTNNDDERALEFNFSLNQNLVENNAGNGTAVLSFKPNIPILQDDAILVLELSPEKDNLCNFNTARALFQTVGGNVTRVEIPYKQEAFDTRSVTLVAPANTIDDDTENVLIKASVRFAGTSFPLADNLVATATGGNAMKDVTNTFYVPVFDDADNAAIVDVTNGGNGGNYISESPIWVFNTKEVDKKTAIYPVWLNSTPRGAVFITAYVQGADDASRVDVTSNESVMTVKTEIGGQLWTGVVLKLTEKATFASVSVTVKDNNLKDGDKLVRLRFANATVENSCDNKYTSLKPIDAFIRITDDATDIDAVAKPGNAPAKVAGLVPTAGSKQVVLNWAPNAEAGITYQVYYYSPALGQSKQLAGETTATSFTVSGLTNGVDYVFEVVAVKKDNNGNITAKGENSDTVNAKPSIILGTEKALETSLVVWPNPSSTVFNIRLENLNAKQLDVKVLNVTGQEIYSTAHGKVNGEFETKLELGDVPAGMYVLIVNTDNGSFRTKLVLTR